MQVKKSVQVEVRIDKSDTAITRRIMPGLKYVSVSPNVCKFSVEVGEFVRLYHLLRLYSYNPYSLLTWDRPNV